MTKLLSNIGHTVDPKGYCPHHSAIKLRRQSQPSGEWKTLLSHCPLCSDDGSTLSPRGGRESPSSLLSSSMPSLTSTSSRRSSGRYGRLNRQTTPTVTTLALGLSRLDSSSSSIGSSTRSRQGATYSRLDSCGSINSVNSRRSYHTSSSENKKARELRRLFSSRSRSSSFAKSCSDVHRDGDNECDDHDDYGRKASMVSRTTTQYTKEISMHGLSSILSTDTTAASSTSSSSSGSQGHCQQQQQQPPSLRLTTCSSPVSPSSDRFSESVASSGRSRKWLLPPPIISPLTPASPESDDCDDIASSCSSLMRRKQHSFHTTSTADTATTSNYTKLDSSSSSSKLNNANNDNKKAIVCGLRYTDPATSKHGSYTGQLHPFSQLPHGMGTLRCADGNVCEGRWCDGNLLTAGNESRVQCSKVGGGGGPYDYDDDIAACASDLKSWRENAIHGDVYDDHATATIMSGRTRSVQCEGNRGGDNKTNGSRSHSKARGGASSGNYDDDASSAAAAVPRRMRNVQGKGRDSNKKANGSRSHSKARGGVPSINHDDDDVTASSNTATSRRTRGARGESRGSDRKLNGSRSYSKARRRSSSRNYDDDASATSESMSRSGCKGRQGAARTAVATSRLTKCARGRGVRSKEAEGGEEETTSPSDKDDVSTASTPAVSRRSSMSMSQSRGRRQVAVGTATRKMVRIRSRGRGSEEPIRFSNRSNSRSGGRSIFLSLMGTSGCDEDCSSTIGDCPPSAASSYTSNDAHQDSQLLICADLSSGSSSASRGGGERARACSRGDYTPGPSEHRGKEVSASSHDENRAETAIAISLSSQFEREDRFEQRQQRQPILQRALVPYINKTDQERRLEEKESNIIGDDNSQGTCEKNLCSRRSQGRSCARKNRQVSLDSTSIPPSGPYSAMESKGTPSSNASIGPRLNKDSSWSTRRFSVGLLKESELPSSSSTTAAESSRRSRLLRFRSRQEDLERRRVAHAAGGGALSAPPTRTDLRK